MSCCARSAEELAKMSGKQSVFIHVPYEPFPQGRPRVTRWGTYDPSKDKKNWFKTIAADEYFKQRKEPIKAPIEIEIIFVLPIPKSTSKKKAKQMIEGSIKHVKKPDLDNLSRLVTDGLTGIVYEDDRQIYKMVLSKKYGECPSTSIHVCWSD